MGAIGRFNFGDAVKIGNSFIDSISRRQERSAAGSRAFAGCDQHEHSRDQQCRAGPADGQLAQSLAAGKSAAGKNDFV